MNSLFSWLLSPIQYVKRSFYRKMLLSFFAIIILTVLSLGVNFYVQTSRNIKQNAISNMERLTDQSVQTMESQLDNIQNEAWSFFGDTDFQSLVKHITESPEKKSYFYKKLLDMGNNNKTIDVILVNDLSETGLEIDAGKYQQNSKQTLLFKKEKTRLTQIAIHNDGKGAWDVSNIYDPKTNQPIQTLAFTQALKDITDDRQPMIGVLMVELSYDKLQNWLNALKIKDQGDFYLISKKDGSIVLGPNPSYIGKPFLNETNFSEFEKTRSEPYFFIKDHGSQTLIVYKNFFDTDWMLVGKVPVNVLLDQVNSAAKRTLMIGLVALFGAMLLAGLLSSRVLIPINRLRKGMTQIKTGNYNIVVPVETRDEIGFFCQSFNQMADEINRLIMKVYETELTKKDAEIKALQSQMNPHFLYNTLGTIESLASVQGESQKINVICRSLAQMLRYNISGASFSTLGEEIQQINVYLSIQKIRYETRLEYDIYVEPELEKMRIPKLLFQPIVENSIIHGIERSRKGGKIIIEAVSLNERDAEIRVRDNGIGIDSEKLQLLQLKLDAWSPASYQLNNQEISIGIVNVQSRLKLLYGSLYGLAIDSRLGDGTRVTIRLMK